MKDELMSGGSFNYLCYKEPRELLEYQSAVEDMVSALERLGYAKDVAGETYTLLLLLRQFENRIEILKSRLEPVWHAMEWWQSSDIGETDFKDALQQYRNGGKSDT